jgi:tetratricopeptide (TPR) repeat protein
MLKIAFAIGVFMTANARETLPDFDRLWDFGDPQKTEVQFRELLPFAEKAGNLEYKLQLLTQIARTQGLQRKFDEAHATLDWMEPQLQSGTVSEIRFNLERGRVFNSSQKQSTAVPLFVKAYDLAVALKQDNLAVDAAHMVAIAEPAFAKQMEWNLKALSLAEGSSDPKAQGWLGSLYNNIGWSYHDRNQFSEALDMFQKALAFRETRGEPRSIRIAKWCVARVYRSLGRNDEAFEIQSRLEKEDSEDGFISEELAELGLSRGNPQEAKRYFALAYEKLSKDAWFSANEKARLARMKELAGL